MILDMIIIMCIWFGIFFQVIPFLFDQIMPDLNILPWGMLGVVWLIICLGLIRYRGWKSGYWPYIDLPIPGTIIDNHVDKVNMRPQRLYRSRIEDLLKTRKGEKYYRDHHGAALFSGGHEIRFSKDGVNHMLDINDVILTQKLNTMGVRNMQEMDGFIVQQMLSMKKVKQEGDKSVETDIYLLSGTTTPASEVDIENNAYHRAIYDELAKQYSVGLADGCTTSFYQYNNFQRSLASSTDMASAIDYVRSDEAAKATKIKRGMGMSGGKIAIIVVAVVLVLLLVLGFATGAFDGFMPVK